MTLAGEIKADKAPQQKEKRQKGPKRPKRITPDYLHNAGLAYLQRFPASTAHFKTVMGRKIRRSCAFHTDLDEQSCLEMLTPVIENFQRLGLLDDQAYVRGMVTSLRRRGLSAQAIRAKLQAKGIPTEKAMEQISKYDEDEHEGQNGELIAALRLARRKKLGPFKDKDKDDQKQLATLARAGFSYEISSKILSMSSEDVQEFMR